MAEFLTCYDYGTGGVWLYMEAESAAKLVKRYPALTVVQPLPVWWTPEIEKDTRAKVGDPFWDEWLVTLEPNP